MKTQTLIAALLAAMTMLSGCVVAPAPVYREPVYVEPPPPRVIELDGGEIGWLPNFHKPGTPEHAEYEEAMRRAGKKPGDPS